MNGVLHRVPLPRGSLVRVRPGDAVAADDVLAVLRPPGRPIVVPVSRALRRPPSAVRELLVVRPGQRVEIHDPIARADGREVRAPATGLLAFCSPADGTAVLVPLGAEEPVVGHVRGQVAAIEDGAIIIAVPAAQLEGVGGTGEAVHGELVVAVREPGEELRAAAVDVAAAGKILVGGSRASAEALTRARAIGVAGIVLGGVLDKELRDFEAIERRRREIGGLVGSFALVLLEGFGKVGFDPQIFAWFGAHAGHEASLFGNRRLLYVYDAEPPPRRRTLPRVGERVVAHRRPFQGRGGALVAVLDELHAAPSGIGVRMGLVRFEDGRLAPIPLANLEASIAAPAEDRGATEDRAPDAQERTAARRRRAAPDR